MSQATDDRMNQARRGLTRIVLGHSTPAQAPVMWWTWRLARRTLEQSDDWVPVPELAKRQANHSNPRTLAHLLREARRQGVIEYRGGPGRSGGMVRLAATSPIEQCPEAPARPQAETAGEVAGKCVRFRDHRALPP